MADKENLSFEQWLEKESQAMNELYDPEFSTAVRAARPAPVPEEKSAPAPVQEDLSAPAEAEDLPAPAQEDTPAPAPAAPLEESSEEDLPEAGKHAAPGPAPAREPLRPQTPVRRPVRYSGSAQQAADRQAAPERRTPPRRPPVQTVQPDRAGRPGGPGRTGGGWDGNGGGRGGNRWLNWLIPLAAVLMVLVILLAVGFAQAKKVAGLDTIYPNVSVNGISVGEMTVEQAAQALGDAADRYENAAVTVNFPTGDSVTVTAQDLGLKPADGTALAQSAYDYGRDGSLLENWRTYRACKSEPVDLTGSLVRTEPDEAAIRALVGPAVLQVNEKLGVVKADVGEDQIQLVKNLGASRVDQAEVCQKVKEAFVREDYSPIDYQLPEASGQQEDDGAALLQELYDQVFVEPMDAQYDQVTGGVIQGVQGVRFDMDEAMRLWQEAQPGQTVIIPLIREDPEVTAEQLEQKLFADVLSEKSTSLAGSSAARINNITLAAAALNGTVIQPGEEFDYNTCLGERTAARGYQAAGVYSNGKHETALGGGICQGSSTLYYCAMVANLTITVRYDHYFTVNYLPLGMDATVSWGGPDFRFRNSRDYPIKIQAYVANGYLTIKLLGTDVDGSYVKITNTTWEDADFYYAQTYRNVYDKNGNLLSSTKEASSRYHKEEAETATPTPAPTNTPAPTAPPAESPPAAQTTPPEPTEAPPEPTEAPPEPTEAPPEPTDEPSPEPVDTPEPPPQSSGDA